MTYKKIDCISANAIGNIQLLDINGHLLFGKKVTETKTILDISEYAAGVYVIRITDNAGMKVKRLVIKK